MTGRGLAAVAALITSALCALSLGNALYAYMALLLALLLAYGLVSCLWALFSVSFDQRLTPEKAARGEICTLTARARCGCPLPLGPMKAVFSYGGQEEEYVFPTGLMKNSIKTLSVPARHVGQFDAGVKRLEVCDLFGLFRMPVGIGKNTGAVTVLPRPFDIEKPRLTLGEDGSVALARSQEDYNAPEDVRPWRPGDAMKRIHWKLSSRKREILVRRFETPAPPDTLILLDCDTPLGGENVPEGEEKLVDALCETAVAVARMQMEDGSPVRLPMYGKRANEFASDQAEGLALLQEMLAMQPFGGGEDFARVLNLELRRMRRTGATVIITTRLNARIVEAVSHIRRMGPSARLYLATFTPEAETYQPFVAQLQHHLVEVCYVTPA